MCGKVQSYDEVRDRRKNCIECGVPYTQRKAWGQVGTNRQRVHCSVTGVGPLT
jgi:hypothetical protein